MRKVCIISTLLLLLIFPPCGHALLKFKGYTVSHPMTWKQGQAFCRKHFTDLVTIRNGLESKQYQSVYGWIGLYRDDAESSWKWSSGDEIAKYYNWDNNEPQSHEHCALKFAGTTKWINANCDHTFPFICYDELLVLVKEDKTWEEALDHCRSLERTDTNNPASLYKNHSYDLVTMISKVDHDYVRHEAQKATTDEVWTGLRFLASEWLWVSGEEVQYNIPSCEADRFCGVLEKSSTSPFGIRSCSERRNFICYKNVSIGLEWFGMIMS